MKIFFLLLLAAACNDHLHAQTVFVDDSEQRRQEWEKLNRTEQYFRPAPWMERNKAVFHLPNQNRLTISMLNIDQAAELPDLDSLLRSVWAGLQPFSDSFAKPLVNRRVDYVTGLSEVRIRLQEFLPTGIVYRIKADDTTQLKVEQDTLSIKLYSRPSDTTKNILYEWNVILHLNNITDLPSISTEHLEWITETLKNDAALFLGEKKKTSFVPFQATYNVVQQKRFHPIPKWRNKNEFIPHIYAAFQHLRGAWVPSAGVGLELKWWNDRLHYSFVRLTWEPYFFFSRSDEKRTVLDRTDFITASFADRSLADLNTRTLRFSLHFSAAYALRTKGDWLEPTTFKFSFPGFENRNLMLYPEFYFNRFFKNFSPSLRLKVDME